MTQRKNTYGYRIQNGKYIIHYEEAETILKIYDMYLDGLSYEKTSRTLIGLNITYLPDAPIWNKHIIKRILENPKYKGNDMYPCIVSPEKFDRVQALIATKSQSFTRKEKTAADIFLQRLTCGKCGSPLPQVGGRCTDKDIAHLKCKTCGSFYKVSKSSLHNEIVRQINEHTFSAKTDYEPSETVYRLTQTINRQLEQPDNPKTAISTILECINARYQCCHIEPIAQKTISRLTEMTLLHFGKTVSSIEISGPDSVSVRFN